MLVGEDINYYSYVNNNSFTCQKIYSSSDSSVLKISSGGSSKALKAGTLFITPGVRPAGAAVGDQKRVATPADAVRDGATHLVVGRPVLAADDPSGAARAILAEMNAVA